MQTSEQFGSPAYAEHAVPRVSEAPVFGVASSEVAARVAKDSVCVIVASPETGNALLNECSHLIASVWREPTLTLDGSEQDILNLKEQYTQLKSFQEEHGDKGTVLVANADTLLEPDDNIGLHNVRQALLAKVTDLARGRDSQATDPQPSLIIASRGSLLQDSLTKGLFSEVQVFDFAGEISEGAAHRLIAMHVPEAAIAAAIEDVRKVSHGAGAIITYGAVMQAINETPEVPKDPDVEKADITPLSFNQDGLEKVAALVRQRPILLSRVMGDVTTVQSAPDRIY